MEAAEIQQKSGFQKGQSGNPAGNSYSWYLKRFGISHNGERLLPKEWAARLGISTRQLADRIRRVGVSKALETPRQPRGAHATRSFFLKHYGISHNGERLVIREWAARIGITHEGLSKRIRKWGVSAALETQRIPRGVRGIAPRVHGIIQGTSK